MEPLAQRTSKNLFGNTAHLTEPKPEGFLKPRIPPPGAISPPAQPRVKRVCYMIDIASSEPSVIQAKADRTLWELMRVPLVS